jgi:diguanylate cyclase (GGDEF)-like protein
MSRFRRSRRASTSRWAPWTPWVGPCAGIALATSAAGVAHPALALTTGAVATALAAITLRRHAARDASLPTEVDIDLVRRGLQLHRDATDDEIQMIRDAGHAVREATGQTLHLVRSALRARTAAVLWTDNVRATARVRCADTSVRDPLVRACRDDAGVLERLGRHRDPLIINRIAANAGALPWYTDDRGGHLVGIMLVREGVRLGFLVVDRDADAPPFEDADASAVVAAAEQVALTMRTESLVVEAAHARREIALVDASAARLNEALTLHEVCETAAQIVGQMLPFDACVISAYDEQADQQRVIYADGLDTPSLAMHAPVEPGTIADTALQRMETLPYSALWNPGDTPALVSDDPLRRARSLLVFPMAIGPRRVGTLVIAHQSPDTYDRLGRTRFSAMLTHITAALANALAYADMFTRATTDGMTGLTNHRTFKEQAELALARARRSGRPLSLIMTDIDHFKKVNDTHGHAVGDEVIRGVANVLATSHRDVDLAARYGGEEFAVLLEETDIDAAVQLAERLRQRASALQFDGANGPFSVTLSLGVAQLAPSTMSLAELVDAADQALYGAKHAGRNQVVRRDDLDANAA